MAKYQLTHTTTTHEVSAGAVGIYSSVSLMGDTKVTPNRVYNFVDGIYVTEDPEEIKELDTNIKRTQVPHFEKVEE